MRRNIAIPFATLLIVGWILQAGVSSGASPGPQSPMVGHNPSSATSSELASRVQNLLRWGYVRTPGYIQAKARIDRAFFGSSPASPNTRPEAGSPPVAGESFAGLSDPSASPSAATGAVGPTRFIELVQEKY